MLHQKWNNLTLLSADNVSFRPQASGNDLISKYQVMQRHNDDECDKRRGFNRNRIRMMNRYKDNDNHGDLSVQHRF